MRYNLKTKRSLIALMLIVIGWCMTITVANAHIGTGEGHMWEG
jgi:hypothetical protein